MERAGVPRAWLALACVLGLLATGCSFGIAEMNFRVDDRLEFTAPASRALVTEPVTVSWTVRDFTVRPPGSGPASRNAGYFALFVDRAPIRPGQTLEAVADDDPTCEVDPDCPDEEYLALRQVYTTTDRSFTLEQVFPLESTDDDTQLHDVTVVLLDTDGRRIGESAWTRSFKLEKRSVG